MPLTRAFAVASRIFPPSKNRLGTGPESPLPICLAAEGPETKPPVRIFVGTEPGQHRAERVFIWSIEQVRDRTRSYEIYLMKSLAGFDRRGWLTGFTNYRFGIPAFAGGEGRAIYNDVDQIYLTDPGELFDTDMGAHGFMSISDRDTSVMLIDCERMREVWPLELAQRGRRKAIESRARRVAGCWGGLNAGWNARDSEYEPGASHVVHFTTIHTQPWRPFPEQYVYQDNPVASVWNALEASADRAGFSIYDCDDPPAGFRERLAAVPRASSYPRTLDTLRAATGGSTLAVELGDAASVPDETALERWSPLRDRGGPRSGSYDTVACLDAESVAAEDRPWLLQDLASRAETEFFVTAWCDGEREKKSLEKWTRAVRDAVRRHPDLHWTLVLEHGGRTTTVDGGRRDGARPNVWVLANHKPGHTTQSVGLAQALGEEYEVRNVGFSWLSIFTDRLLGNPLLDPLSDRRSSLTPPWPDLVISTGWHTIPVARWIREQSGWRTRIVQLGRKGGNVADQFDAVVTCKHFRLIPHDRRIETVAPLSQVTPERLDDARTRWPDLFDGVRPRVVALVGGETHQHRFGDEIAADLGRSLRAFTDALGGSLTVVNSRRTGERATDALETAAGKQTAVYRWRADAVENPYLGYLAGADVLVVTGDSESMIAEAAAVGRPMYIYSLPSKPRSAIQRFSEAVTRKAFSRPTKKKKGTVKPQRGLVYLCARAVEHGVVNPPRDLGQFYAGLYDQGIARPFTESPDPAFSLPEGHEGLDEAARAAALIRSSLGWPERRRPAVTLVQSETDTAASGGKAGTR